MASVYPGALDTLPVDAQDDRDSTSGVDQGTSTGVGYHAALHNLDRSAINAIEGELGLDPAGSAATVRARLDDFDASLAAKQDASSAATDAELAAHEAAKTGVHGIPAMATGQGLLWNAGNWLATDLATQAELDTHAAATGNGAHVPAGGIANAQVAAAAGIAKSKLAALAIADADVDAAAAIAESKVSFSDDAAAGTASRRTLGKTGTKAAGGVDTEYAFSSYKDLTGWFTAGLASAEVAGTYLMYGGNDVILGGAVSSFAALDLDPADYGAGSRTVYLRVKAFIRTNAVAPGVNFTIGLYPVTGFGGASNVFPTITTVGAASGSVAINAPALSSTNRAVTADFAFPAAGVYALAYVTSGNAAANSQTFVAAKLQIRQV